MERYFELKLLQLTDHGRLRWRRFRGDDDRTGRESLELRQASLPVKIAVNSEGRRLKLEEYRRGKYDFT